MATDPFTLVHNKLWTLLEANTGFTALVTTTNRIKYSGNNRNPDEPTGTTKSYPKVRIVPQSLPAQSLYGISSCNTNIVVKWAVQVETGDQRPGQDLYPLTWEVIRALYDVQTQLATLTWASQGFVKSARFVEAETQKTQRGITGWDTAILLEVDMWFATSDLAPS